MRAPEPRFLLDEHVGGAVAKALAERGVDAVGVAGLGLRGASDEQILSRAASEERIVVTRDYRDFALLVESRVRRGISFPGVLFLPPLVTPGNVGAEVKALLGWVEAQAGGSNPVADGYGWVEPCR